ncbi:glycosyltransferase family 39 protein [Flavobacterium sp.]|uniref:ArnT family glycosyltransferase n=1 Tax=Flavobacterium sp. TaxID=239 RepID=UPI003341459B
MKIDAAQYASIAFEMLTNNSYLQVTDMQTDYLDKPPLLFWISSVSMGLFGVCNFAYKMGTFLMLLLSLFAVYKVSIRYYNHEIAKNATLIFATCQAFYQMTNDVRTDGLLTSSVIISIWLLVEYFFTNKIKYLVFGAVFTAFAMLSKGPIGIIAVLMPIGLQLLYKKDWKQIFNINWIVFLVVVALLLLPMSYGLYQQFDLHPEKIINGKQNQSGLYFYYWLQSFGRITGESVWDNGLPWHFFIGSISWDFFPWILVLYAGLFLKIKNSILKKTENLPEIITLSGFLVLFILLSLSKYKLPHYIFVTLPFASIICASYFDKITSIQYKIWNKIYVAFGCLVFVILFVYPLLFFKEFNSIIIFLIVLQLLLLYFRNTIKMSGTLKLISYVIVLNLFLSFVFYPKLLSFQADSMAGKWVTNNKATASVYLIDEQSHAFNFYSKNTKNKTISIDAIETVNQSSWFYINEERLQLVKQKYDIVKKIKFADYPITRLKLSFLLEETRPETLNYYYLIQLKKKYNCEKIIHNYSCI